MSIVFGGFALLAVPAIFAHPRVYTTYGNFFEQLSLAAGPLILSGSAARAPERTTRRARAGVAAFALCALSFAIEQGVYLSATEQLVPAWIPPGQAFWAIATTVAFALAGASLLTGYLARWAAWSITAMLASFGVLVWVPALVADAHRFATWSEATETFAIAASAWIVADELSRTRGTGASPRCRV